MNTNTAQVITILELKTRRLMKQLDRHPCLRGASEQKLHDAAEELARQALPAWRKTKKPRIMY